MPVVIRIAVSLVVTRRSSTYRLVRAAPYRQSRYAGLRTPVDGVPRYGGPAARAAFTGSRTCRQGSADPGRRSEEHTSELQSLMRITYAALCFKKNIHTTTKHTTLA